MISVTVAHVLCQTGPIWAGGDLAALMVAAAGFYATNTVLVTTVIALVERRSVAAVWDQCHLWAFPYHLIGAALLGIVASSGVPQQRLNAPVAVLPLMLLAHLCYRTVALRAVREGHAKAAAA